MSHFTPTNKTSHCLEFIEVIRRENILQVQSIRVDLAMIGGDQMELRAVSIDGYWVEYSSVSEKYQAAVDLETKRGCCKRYHQLERCFQSFSESFMCDQGGLDYEARIKQR
jgi:hypothetical protein